jgi:hypothetical protein
MLWSHVLIWGIIFSTLIIIIMGTILTLKYTTVKEEKENYSSSVYDQWHPPNYFQGSETVNEREQYSDWMPYPHLYTKINLGSWDKPKPIQKTTPKSIIALTTKSS